MVLKCDGGQTRLLEYSGCRYLHESWPVAAGCQSKHRKTGAAWLTLIFWSVLGAAERLTLKTWGVVARLQLAITG